MIPWFHRARRCLMLACFSLGLSNCTMVGPDFKSIDADLPEDWFTLDPRYVAEGDPNFSEWWTQFNDPVLNEVIAIARRHNKTLEIAGVRIYEARAALGLATGLKYPQIQTLSASAARIELSENGDLISSLPDSVASQTDTKFTNYGVSIDAVWELDFWGRIGRGVEAASANLMASDAAYGQALVAVTAEVSTLYLLLRSVEDRLDITRRNVGLQRRSLQIARVRFDNGLTTELDVQQATALLRDTESLVTLLDTDIRRLRHALGVLTGGTPRSLEQLLGSRGGLPESPRLLNPVIPAELLRRRPDIRRAEMRAAAQNSLIGVAKADMYPAFRLFGSVGYLADSTGDVFKSSSETAVGAFSVLWKFLNYGRLKNAVRIQDARFQQLIQEYQLTVLTAAREVEDALVGYGNSREEVKFKTASARAAERAVEIALVQYRDGVTDYITVLDTQRIQLQQQDAVVGARTKVGVNLVAAYKAMGGGWQLRANDDYVGKDIQRQMTERTNWGDFFDAP